MYTESLVHPHFAAEGIVADGLLNRIVAADHHSRTAQVVGDTLTGGQTLCEHA